ncbi:VanZ family protein [Brachybacterium sp. J153]|uniref:VanZ family protein n=1 Tax=Brachybacterium sp. J153 TaxID=3116488 RepID=UPI002E76E7DC|nr:VanZ family protein [Brachybacterium sp. J153]MEE1616956.1 VanZ family protein [Brachybacterium sp. J153]
MSAPLRFALDLPVQIREVGGSLPLRIVLAVLALVLNSGFYLPSIPSGTPGVGVPGLDKIYHLVVLALTVWALGRLLAPRRRFPIGWVVIVALAQVLLVELVQSLALPERSGDLGDAVAGVLGIGVGLGAWILERRRSVTAADADADAFDGDMV